MRPMVDDNSVAAWHTQEELWFLKIRMNKQLIDKKTERSVHKTTRDLLLPSGKLPRTQLLNNGDAGAGAEAVGPGLHHGLGCGSGADTSRGFDSGAVTDYAAH